MNIALSDQPLLGQPVMVKPFEAEKNLVQSTTSAAVAVAVTVAATTAAVANRLIGLYSGELEDFMLVICIST